MSSNLDQITFSQFKDLGEIVEIDRELFRENQEEDFGIEHYLDALLQQYKTSTMVNIETNEQGLWKITIFHNSKKTIVGVDVNIAKNGFPQARVLEPRFLDSDQILWNGILVETGLTANTFKLQHDFIATIISIVTQNEQVPGSKYGDVALNAAFARIGNVSISHFTPIFLKAVLREGSNTDEITVSSRVQELIMSRISNSDVWFLEAETLYFELETTKGLKCIAKLSQLTHYEQDNVVVISDFLSKNLLLGDDLDMSTLSLRLVRVPVAKSITLQIQDPVFRRLSNTHEKVKSGLSFYTTFTAGTVVTIHDAEFDTFREVAVLEVEAWEPNNTLRTSAVTTVVPSRIKADMLVIYSDNNDTYSYHPVDPLEIYQKIQQVGF